MQLHPALQPPHPKLPPPETRCPALTPRPIVALQRPWSFLWPIVAFVSLLGLFSSISPPLNFSTSKLLDKEQFHASTITWNCYSQTGKIASPKQVNTTCCFFPNRLALITSAPNEIAALPYPSTSQNCCSFQSSLAGNCWPPLLAFSSSVCQRN